MLSSGPIQALIDDMIETMIEYSGVGLAAPQVHESLQLAVIESKGPRGEIPLTVLVNPTFTVLDSAPLQGDWGGDVSAFPICVVVCRVIPSCESIRWTGRANGSRSWRKGSPPG